MLLFEYTIVTIVWKEDQFMTTEKIFASAKDIQKVLGCSESYAYKLVQKLNAELEKLGYITVRGKVNYDYLEKRLGTRVRDNANV